MDFAQALLAAGSDPHGKGIGTLGEKTLHLALKYYFAPDPETHERRIGGFIADAVTEEGVIEIQTRSLGRLKPKLAAFLPLCPVTVVHPIVPEKWVIRANANGEIISRRKSPKHETVYTAMREIYLLRKELADPNLRICLCELELEEYSVVTGKRNRKKLDRIPVSLRGCRMLETPQDYAALLPDSLPETFTVRDVATILHQRETDIRYFFNILSGFGIIETAGRRGKQKLWQQAESRSDTIRG